MRDTKEKKDWILEIERIVYENPEFDSSVREIARVVEQELDRAREEGIKEVLGDLRRILNNSIQAGNITKDPELEIKRVLIGIDLLEEDKLTTK